MPNNIMIDESFILDDLAEKVDDISPETASFSWEDSDARMVYNDIPGNHLIDALMLVEGYCWTELDVLGNTVMRRKNAMVHPKYPWMRANKVESVEGYGGISEKVDTLGSYTMDPTDTPSATNQWDKYRITVSFNTPEYSIITDNELDLLDAGNELLRYCYNSGNETATSAIAIQGGQVKFAAGQTVGANTELNAPSHNIFEAIQTIKLTWTKISEDYIQAVNPGDPLGGGFYKLSNALGCVNSTTFLGRRPGTLLMDPFAYRRKRMPVRTTDGTVPFWSEVEFTLRFFDPTPAPTCTANKFGWLLAPNAAGGYFYVTIPAVGAAPARDLYNSFDFNTLFTPHA
jgi:hypothetical protein